ncbi:SbcC/MukB-like Walker B domain-containing protein [Thiomicrorhabdus sp. Kp2]|uniref:SbcC/MukB-like Walker B domain-containing protein n=1 Tax=Thiomicrorhabdus sp. Kp2 TaxID=1123518 RepID=UPI00350F650D
MVFEHPDNGSHVSLFVGIEAYEDDPAPNFKVRGVYQGNRALEAKDFITAHEDGSYESLTALDLKKSLSLQGIEPYYADKAKDFMEAMVKLIGPTAHHDWIDPEALRSSLAKSISLKKEITEVSQFVENFVLESRDIKVDDLIRTKNHYQNLTTKISELSQQKQDLDELHATLNRTITQRKKMYSLLWIALEKQLEATQEDQYARKQDLAKNIQKRWDNRKTERQLKKLIEGLRTKQSALSIEISNDDEQRRKDKLIEEIGNIDEKIDSIQRNMLSDILHYRQFCQQDVSVLHEESINLLMSKMRPMLEQVANPSFDFESFDELAEALLGQINAIEDLIEHKQKPLIAREVKIENQITTLTENINRVSSGKRLLTHETEFLIQYLEEHGIQATPVCNVVEISDVSWQPAIEAFLANNVEALIVPEDQEVEAIRLYRGLKKTHQIYKRIIVKASLCVNWYNSIDLAPNSAATLLESSNHYALGFLYKLLGRLELVDSDSELRRSKFALSKDGMVANSVGVSRLKLISHLKMMKDQSHNLETWRHKRRVLSTEKDDEITPTRSKLKDVSDSLAHLKIVQKDTQRQSFQTRNLAVKRQAKLKEKNEELLEGIDLTHIENLTHERDKIEKKLLPQRTKELERLLDEKGGMRTQIKGAKAYLLALNKKIEAKYEEQVKVEASVYFDAQYNDELQIKSEDKDADTVMDEHENLSKQFDNALTRNEFTMKDIAESNESFNPVTYFPLNNETLEPVVQYVHECITNIVEMNIVKYEEAAERASKELNESFRNDVTNRLREVFKMQNRQFRALNKALSQRLFHSERYKFIKKPKSEFKDLIDYIEKTDLTTNSDDLFDSMPPEVEAQIELLISSDNDETLNIRDYRKYFVYDVEVTSDVTQERYYVSDQMGTGSGGEKQSPFYVAIASSLATAWGTLSNPGRSAGLALLDEAFDKLDEENLKNAMDFMGDTGLQVIVATPAQQEYVFKPAVNSVIYVSKHILSRDNATASLDIEILTEKGWEIFNPVQTIPSEVVNE